MNAVTTTNSKINAVLNLAMHPNTPEHEAMVAFGRARAIAAAQGIALEALLATKAPTPQPGDFLQFQSLQIELARAQTLNIQKDREIARLRRALEEAEAEAEADGEEENAEIEAAERANALLEAENKRREEEVTELRRIVKENGIDLGDVGVDKKNEKWTMAEYRLVDQLLAQNTTLRQCRAILLKQFGKIRTVNAIWGARNRIIRMKKDGKW